MRTHMFEWVVQLDFFAPLRQDQVKIVAEHMVLEVFEDAAVVFDAAEPATTFYLVLSGTVALYHSPAAAANRRRADAVAVYRAGDGVGEEALQLGQANSLYTGTCVALEQSQVHLPSV